MGRPNGEAKIEGDEDQRSHRELSSYAEATYTAMAGGTEQFEAESSSTTLAGGAKAVACVTCSGGYRVEGIGSYGGTTNGTATW